MRQTFTSYAIRSGLMADGTQWQACFVSVTRTQPLAPAEQKLIAKSETILSGDRYFPVEEGPGAAKLRDLMDGKFDKDMSARERYCSVSITCVFNPRNMKYIDSVSVTIFQCRKRRFRWPWSIYIIN